MNYLKAKVLDFIHIRGMFFGGLFGIISVLYTDTIFK